MAVNNDKVDLSDLNSADSAKKQSKIARTRQIFKKKKGPARDDEGKFTSGSGGLRQFKFNWKRALPIVIAVALVGGFFVYQSFAGPSRGITHESLNTSTSIGVRKVSETRASKRNARVVEISNSSNATARAVYTHNVTPGMYEVCAIGVSQNGSPRGSFSVRGFTSSAGTSLGSDDYTARSGDDYKKLVCIPINHRGGSSNNARNLEFMVTNTAPNTSLRVSIILLEDRDSSHVHESCRIGQLGMHGPCIDMDTMPTAGAGISKVVMDTSNYRGAEPSAFRSRCDYSHMANDDPILYPNRPGEAHLHAFFGNTLTNARSTSESLMTTGKSTCAGGIFNRSAYWVPSMIDSSTGKIIKPSDPRSRYNSDLEIYYKLGYQGIGYNDVRPFPNGLHMIAGNSAVATGPTSNTKTKYWCETMDPVDREHRLSGSAIPDCGRDQILVMEVQFPQCWNGRDLTSSNGRSHLTYGTWQPHNDGTTRGCPSTHPVGLPFVQMFVRYYTGDTGSANWRLSSDRYTNGPGGYSGHADYMFAWDEEAFPTIKRNCYQARIDCAYNLGDGREPDWTRDANAEWRR